MNYSIKISAWIFLTAFFAAASYAQPYPSKVVRMVVAFGAGSGNDTVGRIIAARSAGIDTRKLKTPVFQSSGDAVTALLGGHIDLHIGSVGALAKQVEGVALRPARISVPAGEETGWGKIVAGEPQ